MGKLENAREGSAMEHITLSDEQLSAVANASEPVDVRDQQGRLRGFIAMVIGSQELADAKRALAGHEARYTTAQVLAAVHSRGTP
jgi:hypothetical protein